MFCTSCGAQAHDGDFFCPECGKKLKHSSGAGTASAQPAGNPFAQTTTIYNSYSKPEKKKNKGAVVIVILMIAVVLAMLFFAGSRGYFGNLTDSCAGCSVEDIIPISGDALSDSDVPADSEFITPGSGANEAAITSTATATETTTTVTTTTTTTTVDAKKKEAEEIRKLLISKEWTTEIEGYKANIKFRADGTATITIKVLFITQTIDAQYSVNDKCHAVIMGEYGGNTYGISGEISKASNTKLVVERDKNMGKVTLTAV